MHSNNIENRQVSEKVFHDQKYSHDKRKDYYSLGFTSIILQELLENLGDIKDKKVLEFGCGEGWFTKILASKGAEVWTFDISGEVVKKVKKTFDEKKFKHPVHVEEMAAEKLTYDSNMFDLVIGNAILHHIDLETGIGEIHRVLKEEGKAYFMEPLGHNPLLNLYRYATPSLRSKDETPLRFEQFSHFSKSFSKFKHSEYYFLAMLALILYFLGMNRTMMKSRDALHKCDRHILEFLPVLKKYCWYTLLEFTK